jgi:hypothetical protein
MSRIIEINNPLGLTRSGIRDYLTLVAKAGRAEYEHILNYSASTLEELIESRAKLDVFKLGFVDSQARLGWNRLVSANLIEEMGFALWNGKFTDIGGHKGKDYLVGKIVELLNIKSTGEKGYLVATQTEDLQGLDVFGNYSGLESTNHVYNNRTARFYLIKNAAIRNLLGDDPSKEIRFQDFYD